jgi:hypothetical protein
MGFEKTNATAIRELVKAVLFFLKLDACLVRKLLLGCDPKKRRVFKNKTLKLFFTSIEFSSKDLVELLDDTLYKKSHLKFFKLAMSGLRAVLLTNPELILGLVV